MKPLLVGECGGKDPWFDLYPLPSWRSGGRLAKHLGLDYKAYIDAFDRTNLCRVKWITGVARWRAALIVASVREKPRPVILLGAKVCQVFGVTYEPLTRLVGGLPIDDIIILPHPSGLCRAWNDHKTVDGARFLVSGVLNSAGT